MCLNFLLFGLTLKVAGSIPRVNKALIGFLLLLNLELIPALTTLNKEIFALLGSALTAKYLYSTNRPKWLLCAALFVSACARWEQVGFLLLYFLLNRFPFRHKPLAAILTLVAVITVVYPFSFKLLGIDPSALDWLMGGATTLVWLNTVQNAFGFPLLVIPKILMTITGELHSPQYYDPNFWRSNFSVDPQNMLFLPMDCLAFTILFAHAVWTKRMRLSRPIAFLSMITLVVVAATPFIQPRYIFGVYMLLAIDTARPLEPAAAEPGRISG